MKKAIYTLLAGLFLALAVPLSVSALPGGLLDGKSLYRLETKTYHTKMTDGDMNTYETVWVTSSNPHTFTFELERPTDIDYVMSHARPEGHGSIPYLRMYDEFGVLLIEKYSIPSLQKNEINKKGVKKIQIVMSPNWGGYVYEFDIFGNVTYPRPVNLQTKSETGKVNLSWQIEEDDDAFIGYDVYRDMVQLNDDPLTDAHYVDTTATPGQQYKYKVTAVYRDGITASDEVMGLAYPDPLPEPQFQADAWNDRFRLSWTDTGAVNYILSTGSRRLTEGKVTAYTHTGLEKDTEYPYLLEWVDKYGRKGNMVKTFRTTLEKPPPPPEPPASLQARPGHQMVTLTWARSPRDDIVGYRVYQDGEQLPGQQRGPTMDVRGLENGREYRFYVTSISDTGEESGPSPEARATPRSEPAPGTGIDPGEVQWGFGPGDILTNSGAILLMLSAFVLLGIVVMYVKPLIGLIREAVKPG